MKFGAGGSGAIRATLVRLLEIQMDEWVVDIQMRNGWWAVEE